MKKKILSLVLVVAMLASMMVFVPVSGAVEKPATLEFTNAAGTAGDTVTVDLVVTTAAFSGMQFVLDYDESKLTFNGITWTTAHGTCYPKDLTGGDAYKEMFENSPYEKVLSYALDAIVIDLSDGEALATLSFTINADAPVGDTVVGFAPAAGANNKVNYGTASYTSEQIEFVNGAVTVLPAGYLDFDSADSDGFSFPNDKAPKPEPGPVDTYEGKSTGVVIVPETAKNKLNKQKAINGLDTAVFVGTTFTTLIIPAHVETVAEMAIFDPAVEALSIYVMGDTQFADLAVYLDESSCQVTIYAKAGSAAAEYAVAEGHNYVPFTPYNLTVGESSYVVSSNVQAPGVSTTDDGKVVIGWTANGVTYAPGAAMTLTGDTELEPVTIKEIKMNTGVGFKVTDDITTCKMRFTTNMDIADYNTLASLGKVTVGTIITPAAYVSMAGGLTKEALNALGEAHPDKCQPNENGDYAGVTYIDVVAGGYFTATEDTYTFAGSLAGFKADNIKLEYAAAFYATVELADGSSFTVYSAFDFGANRAVGATIEAARDAVDTQEMKDAYENLLNMIKANKSEEN